MHKNSTDCIGTNKYTEATKCNAHLIPNRKGIQARDMRNKRRRSRCSILNEQIPMLGFDVAAYHIQLLMHVHLRLFD